MHHPYVLNKDSTFQDTIAGQSQEIAVDVAPLAPTQVYNLVPEEVYNMDHDHDTSIFILPIETDPLKRYNIV
ncbi:hypothetical protein GCM10008915_21910 [Bifidobacterium pullorum subsp. gallinarum]